MRRDGGFALVTVVLFMIGLAMLATGLLFAASQQVAVAASLTDLARARHGAETAVAAALGSWSAAQRSLDPLRQPVDVLLPVALDPGLEASASVERLAPEAFLVTGTALVRRGGLPPIRRSAVRLVHSLDLDGVGQSIDAAIIGPRIRVGPGATVTGSSDAGPRGSDGADLCARWPAQGAGLRAPPDSARIDPSAVVGGAPAFVADAMAASILEPDGGLSLDALRAMARPVGSGSISPAPVQTGADCDTEAPANWGAATGACATFRVLRHAAGDLAVTGGYGQGILLVDGDLVVTGGFTFEGVIVVLGTATVRDASISGSLIAARVDLERVSVALEPCAIADALAASEAGRSAYPPARSWLPTFD